MSMVPTMLRSQQRKESQVVREWEQLKLVYLPPHSTEQSHSVNNGLVSTENMTFHPQKKLLESVDGTCVLQMLSYL